MRLSDQDVLQLRQDFPILQTQIYGKPLIYLDNAASTQKPRAVIDKITEVYTQYYSNVHRGVHALSQRATDEFEAVRDKVKNFISAKNREEIVFVHGTTEAINLVAQSFVRPRLNVGDEIIITAMEHHANIVPWQMVCEQTGALLKIAPITDAGEINLSAFEALINSRTRFVSVVHISNTLGTINPIEKIIAHVHEKNIPVMVDGAQAAPHQPLDMQQLKCDFYAFSGHKLFGPTGIGVLYGKADLLNAMPPYHGGGEMISRVTFEKTTYNVLPYKFEAGTPHIAGVIGLGAAIDYIQSIGLPTIADYENALLQYATEGIQKIPGVRLIGTAPQKASILSFVMDAAHPHDIGTILDRESIAIRTGHHCTMPLMQRFNIPATARASFAFYNTMQEVDQFLKALYIVEKVFH